VVHTTARPSEVSVAASPALNATISSSPSAIWCCATAPSRTTSADGQGISPAEAPIATSPRADSVSGGAWLWSWW
jgi:hypothetical protein